MTIFLCTLLCFFFCFVLKDLDSFVQFLLIRRRESLQVRVLGRPELLTDYSRKKRINKGAEMLGPCKSPQSDLLLQQNDET